MSLIEPLGAPALTRGSPHHHAPSAERARAIQQAASTAPVAPVAPVGAATAIAQAQTSGHTQLASEQRPSSLAKPMTAVLLHELRLQQELADLREQKETGQD